MIEIYRLDISLLWRHNGRDNVSNHQPHDCLLNRVFRCRSDQRKHRSSASLAFVRGIHRGPVNSPHELSVTRKMFPFDDVIILWIRSFQNDHIVQRCRLESIIGIATLRQYSSTIMLRRKQVNLKICIYIYMAKISFSLVKIRRQDHDVKWILWYSINLGLSLHRYHLT